MKITLQELSKSYGAHTLFSNFSLDIESETRLCVCGPNGTGKSTLLRMIAGVEPPEGGRVLLPRGCRLGYVEQELDEASLATPLLSYVQSVLHDWTDFWREWEEAAASGDDTRLNILMQRQNELEHMYGYNPEQRARAVLSGLGFSQRKLGRTLGELSGGWRERAKLARVLTAGADVLLLDEPTNHLDMEAVEWLETFLKEFKGALVFVAHDRVFMDNVGTHILYLGGSKPVFRKASYTQFLKLQEEFELQREREAKAIQDDLQRKMAFVERFRAKATKARQAASRQKMAKKLERELEGLRPGQKRRELCFTWPKAEPADKTILSVNELAFQFPDGKRMWPPLSFNIYRGQRIALAGPNGCGKSTLLRILTGRLEKSGGSFALGSQVRMGFFSQHRLDMLNAGGTVLGEIRRLSDPHCTEEELMSVLGLFLLGQPYFERRVENLSGGEKSRLVLATLFLARCNFLVLDEPTNHLDLESREALITALSRFEGTLFMVAHDRHLLSRVAEQIWELSPEGITVYEQGFAQYDAARHARMTGKTGSHTAEPAHGTTPTEGRTPLSREELKKLKREQAARRNALYKELKPLQEAYSAGERELETLLQEQSALETTLADPVVYADGARATELLKRFNALREQGEVLIASLEELEGRIRALETQRAGIGEEG